MNRRSSDEAEDVDHHGITGGTRYIHRQGVFSRLVGLDAQLPPETPPRAPDNGGRHRHLVMSPPAIHQISDADCPAWLSARRAPAYRQWINRAEWTANPSGPPAPPVTHTLLLGRATVAGISI